MNGNSPRPASFASISTDHGSMIVNVNDRCIVRNASEFGVGSQLLRYSRYDYQKVNSLKILLSLRRKYFGDGVLAIDCGANIGVLTVEFAKLMTGWGRVIALEAQEFIYYALAGNIAMNNCLNARAILAAIGDRNGIMKIPVLDYNSNASFGSLELKPSTREYIGQQINYADCAMVDVQLMTLDSLNAPRLDLLKIDIEGMEMEALTGAADLISGQKPICYVELLKSDASLIETFFTKRGYHAFPDGIDCLYVHATDPCIEYVQGCRPRDTSRIT